MDAGQAGALGAARSLALVRIVAGLVIASSADVHAAPPFAALDAALALPPAGLGWLAPLSFSPALAELLRWAVVLGALLGAVGVYSRCAYTLTALGALLLLALPQRVGAVSHVHHQIWIAALLAASPCADVWSADAYFTPRALAPRARYALPLAFARALLAAVYFFPGLHKLLVLLQGVDPGLWLRSHLHWKWLQAGRAPELPFAPDGALAPWLALGAVGFELSMPAVVAFRRTRPLGLLCALAFQQATARLLFIRFETLWVLLSALIDLPPQAPRGRLRALWLGGSRATRAVGSVLLAGACLTGALGVTQGYPFACYPTFAQPAPRSMPSARVDVLGPAGRCTLGRPRDDAEWVQAFRVLGAYGDAPSEARAHAYLTRVLQSRAGLCPMRASATLVLSAEELVWDVAARQHHNAPGGVRVLREWVIYSAPSASFGVAPAEGCSDSSSPAR